MKEFPFDPNAGKAKVRQSEMFGGKLSHVVSLTYTYIGFFPKFVNFHTSLIVEVMEALSSLKIYNIRPTVV